MRLLPVLVLSLVALTVTACAPHLRPWPGDPELATSCDLLGGVTADGPVSCAALRANIDQARDILIGAGLVADDAAFLRWFGDTTITIDTRDRCIDGADSGGCTYAWTAGFMGEPISVHLNRYGDQLLHELIHGVQIRQNVGNTDQHPRWGPLGYYSLSDRFADSAYALLPGPE